MEFFQGIFILSFFSSFLQFDENVDFDHLISA